MPRQAWTAEDLDTMVAQYLESALWSSVDEDGEPLDRLYATADIAPEAVTAARTDVINFYRANRRLLCAHLDPSQAGHDFWLTRNGHGAGFWDRTYHGPRTRNLRRTRERFAVAGERLTKAAHVYREVDLYVGDDDRVHGGQ